MTGRATNAVLDLTCELIRRPSVTPADCGCQEVMGARLQAAGFVTEVLAYGEVTNLWAHRGNDRPLIVFAGHTDVVPSGPPDAWTSPPFEPSQRNDYLYGRGAADMKSSLAAMVVACETFVQRNPRHRGSIGLLITSDEEGPALDGTRRVMEHLQESGVALDYCLVGEPSSSRELGDTIRIGRRGSINARLTVVGVQGHVAYPQAARNPVHEFAGALHELVTHRWDDGDRHFPPTGLQISNVQAGTGASNVIPGVLAVDFNIRFNTLHTSAGLRKHVEELLSRHGLQYQLEWDVSGNPFLTPPGTLTRVTTEAISAVLGQTAEMSTSGGTSDGRFIAPSGCQVVELGPVNDTIHKIDERVRVADLAPLATVYESILDRLLT